MAISANKLKMVTPEANKFKRSFFSISLDLINKKHCVSPKFSENNKPEANFEVFRVYCP